MRKTHTLSMGYILWTIGGLFGLHRFYYDSKKTAWLYLLTFGIFGLGWIYDFWQIKKLQAKIEKVQYKQGEATYSLAWILLVFGGLLGLHKIYLKRGLMGMMYFFTLGYFGIGFLYDLATLNKQVEKFNRTV